MLLAVTKVDCRYLSPARYDDEIEVVTALTRANYRARHVPISDAIGAADGDGEKGRKIATGHTSHIFLNREMRPTTLPDQFRGLFGIPDRPYR